MEDSLVEHQCSSFEYNNRCTGQMDGHWPFSFVLSCDSMNPWKDKVYILMEHPFFDVQMALAKDT